MVAPDSFNTLFMKHMLYWYGGRPRGTGFDARLGQLSCFSTLLVESSPVPGSSGRRGKLLNKYKNIL